VLHTIDYTVPYGPDRIETMLLIEPIDQKLRCRFVIGGVEVAAVVLICARELERQIRPAHADAIHRPMKASIQRFTKLVLREFDAR
jgi:hypothetical protein